MGTVYIMTNSFEGNKVIAFNRRRNGIISLMGCFETCGRGSGVSDVSAEITDAGVDPLKSQYSLINACNKFLFAVNAGNNTVSCFRIADTGVITLADVTDSYGIRPVSLAFCNNVLYVLNAGAPPNVTGFRINESGWFSRLSSTEPLSAPDSVPGSVLFSPDGSQLAVTETSYDRISIFNVLDSKKLTRPAINVSHGTGPLGMDFLGPCILLVAEEGRNAVSSYKVYINGSLTVISGSVENGQRGMRRVYITPDRRYAYTTDTLSGTISVYHIEKCGVLKYMGSILIDYNNTATFPTDAGISPDGKFFYVLNGATGALYAFKIENNGQLNKIQELVWSDVPIPGVQGLAVR
jgi:6-phosphogluconolactonase